MSKLIEKTDEGKIKYYTIDGKLIYPSINNPNLKFNPDGVWETFLIPDNPEDLEMAKKMGVRTKGWEDKEIPESIYFKRFTKNKNGADNKSVIIKNAEGGPFEFNDESGREITIGNQTHAKIMFHYWHHENKWGSYDYYILDGVKVLDLVERQDSSASVDEDLDF